MAGTYRVWAAAKRGAELVVQGDHATLDLAVKAARALATTAVVAVEVPGRKWHTFTENGSETLGPLEDRPDGSERRRSQRFTTSGMRGESVSYLSDGTPVRILDVSAEGLQLQLPLRYRIADGNDITLKIKSRRGVVEVSGIVAWVHRQRCGVRFDWETTPSFAKTYIKGLIEDVGRQSTRRP